MNDLEKAAAILGCIKRSYPAVFHAFELDKVLEHLLHHSQTKVDILPPFVEAMTEVKRSQFTAANPMLLGGTLSFTVIHPMTTKVRKE